MSRLHFDIASQYFAFLAKEFPVMCASDEFHFLPRATDACRYFDRLESMTAEDISNCISELKKYHAEFKHMAAHENELENRIDLQLLMANITGILIELEIKKSWQHNPLLYLKIAFIGLEQALTKPETFSGEKMERATARVGAISRLIDEAIKNITDVPETYYHAALAMLGDCREFLIETRKNYESPKKPLFSKGLQDARTALDRFAKFLSAQTPIPNVQFTLPSLELTLKNHFLSLFNIEEVFQIAVDEWKNNLHELENLQKEINPNKSWQELYHGFVPSSIEKTNTINLYQQESDRLRSFFSLHGFNEDYLGFPLSVIETPIYLRSVRGTASFAAAFTADKREISFFYITTHLPRHPNKKAGTLLKQRLHREYKFLTAHETIPGHQLLDSSRRKLNNPVRRQIESPLFYEGWAAYAETLLTEYGYVQTPIEYLVDYKRRLWRTARCQIDVGLYSGLLKNSDAVNLLMLNGFSQEEAQRQIARFQLNPGYQLCYSLGCYQIKKLVKTYKNQLGEKRIHALLLEGGQLPFHLIEERFRAFDGKS